MASSKNYKRTPISVKVAGTYRDRIIRDEANFNPFAYITKQDYKNQITSISHTYSSDGNGLIIDFLPVADIKNSLYMPESFKSFTDMLILVDPTKRFKISWNKIGERNGKIFNTYKDLIDWLLPHII